MRIFGCGSVFVTTEVTYNRVKSNFKNFKDKLGKFGEEYK